ncbi:MAG TPA: hypothetical protein VM286_04920 [Candidatus Thermoplasmatota archaeon]|nr:hypothetical protein [Candidatus Thermoplasmatota archaeon]
MMVQPGARLVCVALLVVLCASLVAGAVSVPLDLPEDTQGVPADLPVLPVETPSLDGHVHSHGHAHAAELALAPRPAFDQAAPGAAPPLQFRCPNAPNGVPLSRPNTDELGDKTTYGCPFRVYDSSGGAPCAPPCPSGQNQGGYPLGNPQIAVNPGNAAEVAFTALHDQPAPNGPTPRSRGGLTHTTFTSADQGLNWEDQPTQYGGTSGDGVAYLGESSAIAMDPEGNIYLAYLWVLPNGNTTTGYGGAIGLFKAGTTHDRGTVSAAYSSQKSIQSRSSHNIIPSVGITYVAPFQPPANITVEQNGTLVPATDDEVGAEAVVVNHTRERVVAMWFEKAVDYRNSTTGMPGWIDAAITDTSSRNTWSRLDRSQLIGPCRDASNPVAWNGLVYVACQVDRGYTARTRARIGDIDIWALDPMTHNTTLVSTTGLRGGHPMLAATPDGYMALVSVTKRGDHSLDAMTAYSWYGIGWHGTGNIGPELHHMGGDIALQDASINAIAVSEREKTVAIVYMEWAQDAGPIPAQPSPTAPDPANPQAPTPVLTDFRKFVVTGNECGFFTGASQMQMGTSVDPTNMDAYMKSPSIYDDFQDGLVAYQEPNGEDLFYFAINDYGAMQYGAVIAAANGVYCPLPPPLFGAAPAAIPQALTITSAASIAVGATVGVAAVAMVGYILTVKRRVAHFAVAEDK